MLRVASFFSPGVYASLLHTSRRRGVRPGVGGSELVPEGRLIVAQQFTAGEVGNQESLRPGGTHERGD